MKFCTECGSKVMPSNGAYPKFCGECGHAFGVSKAKKNAPVKIEEQSYELSLDSLDFDFSSEEESIAKIENIMGSSDGGAKSLNRKKSFGSIDELRARMRENSIEEA